MSLSRRNFIKVGLMTGAAVSLTACQRNVEHGVVSQYAMPEYALPGQPLYWATSCGECYGGCGVAIKTVDGRAIKMEGLPEHPLSFGAVCARGHSGLQVTYHPSRLNDIQDGAGKVTDRDWGNFFKSTLDKAQLADKQPLFVTRSLGGTLGGLMVELAKEAKGKIWVLDYPGRLAERQVMKALTGKAELPFYRFEDADYAVTFGGDLLALGHNIVRSGWGYGEFRQGRGRDRGTLVSVSSRINMTAGNSDRWLATRPGAEGWVALAVGNIVAAKKGGASWPAWAKSISLEKAAESSGLDAKLIERLAAQLLKAKKPLIVADSDAGNYVNGVDSLYIIHALQKLLTGSIETWEPEAVLGVKGGVPKGLIVNTAEAMKHLDSGNCGATWVFDVDVVSLMPASIDAKAQLAKGGNLVVFSTFANDTTKLAKAVVPILNWIEDFGDQRITGAGLDVYNVQQPAIRPHWENARSLGAILTAVKLGDPIGLGVIPAGAGENASKGKTFRDLIKGDADDARWETLLARGGAYKAESLAFDVYKNRVVTPPRLLPDPGKAPAGVNPYEGLEPATVSQWTDLFVEGPTLVPIATLALKDGSLGNRPWMQELPDPMTTAVWGGYIEMSQRFADANGIKRHDVVKVTVEGVDKPIVGPALPNISMHDDFIGIPVGMENPDYSGWSNLNYGMGSKVFGRYGWTNANYSKGGINPLTKIPAKMTAGGEPRWVGTKVKVEKDAENKVEMITAMDIRVFLLPREILPFE
ncbi:MAG: twin-arginine translocation signal domain-containing protein [Candidatus Eremiobacteraeota bacterium]|nr:twin-arginine translocation signal domain-containing protein [Candidatus Eremiobacteraeota bacterium]